MYEAGGWVLLESAIADLPKDLRWLFESEAVTIEQLATLHEALGATSVADLVDAVERQAVRTVDGLDATVEYAIASALTSLRRSVRRVPLGRAMALLDPILRRLEEVPGVESIAPLGSLRRSQDTVGDIEILAATGQADAAIAAVLELPDIVRILHRGPRRLYVLLDASQIGLRFPAPAQAGALLLSLTGAPAHIAALRQLASQRGWRLEAAGLHAGDRVIAAREEDIYDALGLPWFPPEIRNGGDEFDAARRGTLPQLVTRDHIRGDLHMHTQYSDGRDSVEAMVAMCERLGYEYLAITDHSPHSAASRNLSIESVKRQAGEIAAAQERHPAITVLHGCEVDILPDGKLDFPDRVLFGLDFVIASLHERVGHSPEQLLRRYLTAVQHPLVNLVSHPTNRLVPHRSGYDIDYDRLFETAVGTGTLIEIDGAPAHLDLDGALARRAIRAGVTLALNGDSHRVEQLDRHMRLALATARRGWVEPRHVANTRPLSDIRAIVARKRGT